MDTFNLECGIITESWRLCIAFRIRVSMSAIGSVTGIFPTLLQPSFGARLLARSLDGLPIYKLPFRTPGNSPAKAICLKQIRHRPKCRI